MKSKLHVFYVYFEGLGSCLAVTSNPRLSITSASCLSITPDARFTFGLRRVS